MNILNEIMEFLQKNENILGFVAVFLLFGLLVACLGRIKRLREKLECMSARMENGFEDLGKELKEERMEQERKKEAEKRREQEAVKEAEKQKEKREQEAVFDAVLQEIFP
ncbi:MAG: hypothetical protein PUB46_03180 [Lachnospiraceae bacterium]|uniref:hypothetical protein n=1 Tax=Roseburia hominis TaxID=301301 RepID=UPI001F35CD60|nr:hypothetical protein [Roseburia hominis]MCI5712148.1 hypothetical protein [Lachnospiraceae bacterium]MDD6169069.1 hypothetical protein [Lachnospiraceae bacterium]MDY4839534.1 hypothetical protein [Lachnospiraceae bacterium]